jgi:hypothetical protein
MSANPRARSAERIAVLQWIARIGAATAESLACSRGVSAKSMRASLAFAERQHLLVRWRPLAGRPPVYTLTSAGTQACRLPGCAPRRVSASNALHLIACAEAAAALERCYPDHVAIGERQLHCGEHRPDLLLCARDQFAGELPVAVEVELTVKAPRRLVNICRAWARCREVAGVLYLATPPAERALRRAIGAASASPEVVVVPLAALPGAKLERLSEAWAVSAPW